MPRTTAKTRADDTRPNDTGPEVTRAALIAAGLHLFGHKGFAAASTREIAARAGANVAAIGYHFGSKAGLRLACADEVARRLAGVLSGLEGTAPPATAQEARLRLQVGLRAMVGFLAAAPEAADLAAFLLREMNDEDGALDRLYDSIVSPRHGDLCRLWGLATGTDPDSEDTRLSVFAMVGQIVYFRIGRPIILRRMGWQQMEAGRLSAILIRHLNAALDAASAEGKAR
jgi:AcrR family transcriptional regulator